MKKSRFYTLRNDGDGMRAVLVKGYNAGIWFFYRDRARWYAIDDSTGLAIPGDYRTRKEAAAALQDPALLARIEKLANTDFYRRAVDRFETLKNNSMDMRPDGIY